MNLLELAEATGVTGFLHCDELAKLVELAANRDVLEVGSYRGLSAWGMAITAKSLTACDTFKACSNGQRQEQEFTTLEAFTKATARFNNVRVVPTASEVAAQLGAEALGHDQFDLIFLDAMHDYPNVRDDIHRWWAHLKPGGIMALHDYGHWDFPDVKRAADEIFGPAPEGTTIVTLRWITKT